MSQQEEGQQPAAAPSSNSDGDRPEVDEEEVRPSKKQKVEAMYSIDVSSDREAWENSKNWEAVPGTERVGCQLKPLPVDDDDPSLRRFRMTAPSMNALRNVVSALRSSVPELEIPAKARELASDRKRVWVSFSLQLEAVIDGRTKPGVIPVQQGTQATGAAPAATQLIPLTLEVLSKQFGEPKYQATVELCPVGGVTLERDNIIPTYEEHRTFLLAADLVDPKESSMAAEGDRSRYPLSVVIGCQGSGKTFVLQMIGQHCVERHKDGVALISFGNGSPWTEADGKAGAPMAIAVRILYSLFRHSFPKFSDFMHFCYNHQVPTVGKATEMVCHVAKVQGAAFMLLVDETSSGGPDFCHRVLSTIGDVQQESTKAFLQSKTTTGRSSTSSGPIFTVATSLRPDYVNLNASRSNRPFKRIGSMVGSEEVGLLPFGKASMDQLKIQWTSELQQTASGSLVTEKCATFVIQHLQNSGGLPRAVQWAKQQILPKPEYEGEVKLIGYYTEPPWEVVKMCLRGAKVSPSDSVVSKAISAYGLYLDGGNCPMLPPFQLSQWAKKHRDADGVQGAVALILSSLVPMRPPAELSEVPNDGGQRLQFEHVTQAFELVLAALEFGPLRVKMLFPDDCSVTNLDEDATVDLQATLRRTKLFDFPQSLFLAANDDQLKDFLQGETLVVPGNPNNVAFDYGSIVKFSKHGGKRAVDAVWCSQNKFRAFKPTKSGGADSQLKTIFSAMETASIRRSEFLASFNKTLKGEKLADQTQEKYQKMVADFQQSALDLPQEKVFIIYTKVVEPITDTTDFPANTILVTRRGSERLLSGLGRIALVFDE